ncbi:flagellar protein [Alteribacillus sp. HJP-4]|uniref:flagellar protein n=1 Tax=Alteribacillus sp. HJP-4 TaxID=2775394 RepID=UPI0035CCE43F
MAVVKELFMTTKKLHDHVISPLPKELDARDQYIEELQELLETRASLLEEMKIRKTFSEAELAIGREMVRMNENIQMRLEAAQGELRLGLQELKKKKQSSRRYDRPYSGPTVDGVFFDQKK